MCPLRLLLSLLMGFTATVLLLYATLRSPSDEHLEHQTGPDRQDGLNALFSFTSPGSLFPPSAIISLTDDNSTFFLARPAAFGPSLSKDGLSSPLWVGSGFGDDALHNGELGCSDSPDWDGRNGDLAFGSNHMDAATPSNKIYNDNQLVLQSAELNGKVALLKRGGCGFLAKVQWAQARGAIAVIVGDDVRGGGLIRMYAKGDTSNVTIPSVFTSHTTAHLLSSLLPPESTTDQVSSPRNLSPATTNQQRQAWWANRSHTRAQKTGPPTTPHATGTSIPVITATNLGNMTTSLSDQKPHQGLWVTLTPTNVSTSPFLDTLLVLVVSPLVTLTVVYALLLLRSRIRRRRWRAPKSLVERLPVRTYQTISGSPSASPSPSSSSLVTPLLQQSPIQSLSPRSGSISGQEAETVTTSSPIHQGGRTREEEKRETGLAEWRRRYGGRQRECVVCLEEYEDGISQVMSLPCGHEFHAECITPWLVTRRRTCPICKGDVVRSLAQSYRDSLPSASPARTDLDPQNEDDIQVQAAEVRNDSPTASLPMSNPISEPAGRATSLRDDVEANWSNNTRHDHEQVAPIIFGSSMRTLTSTVSTAFMRGFEFFRDTATLQRRFPNDVNRNR